MVYLFLWCAGIAFAGRVVSGAPVYLSSLGVAGFLGQVAGLLLFSWAAAWLLERGLKADADFNRRLRRIAVAAFVLNIFIVISQATESGITTGDSVQRLIGLVIIGAGAAGVTFAVVMVFRVVRNIAPINSVRWRSRSKAFRVWVFISIFWAIGVFLFVWLFDPYNLGSLSYMDHEEFAHMVSSIVIPPLFFGGLWFGYRRFVV